MRTLAIVLAGGTGKRMGSPTSKQFLLLDSRPILVHTLQVFEECKPIDGVYLVVNHKDLPVIQEEVLEQYRFNKIMKLVVGGRQRQDSVRNGIEAIDESCDIVVIHDAARPFVSPSFIEKSIFLMEMYDAIIPALPVKDTIKVVSKEGYVIKTLERDALWNIQTPQTSNTTLSARPTERAWRKNCSDTTIPLSSNIWGRRSRSLKAPLTT